jgi:hypothetical protein
MTVLSQARKITYQGNGVASSFSFSFVVYASTDLVVTKLDAAGVETVLSEGAGTGNYSVSVASYPGSGSITYPASGASKLAVGEAITIKRVLTLEQATDLDNQGGYFPDVQETALDKLLIIDLQQQELIDRAIKFPVSDSSAISTEFPVAAQRASKFAAFNAAGEPIAAAGVTGVPVSAFAAQLLDDATAAVARATLGSSATGDALFTAASASAARTTLGATATGDALFTAASAAAARTTLDAAALSQSQSWGAGQTPLTATLTDAATVNWDMATAQVGAVTCAAARTFAAPTNQVANRFYALSITNSGGAWAHAFNAAFIFDSNDGTPGSFPASGRLHLVFRSDGTNLREWGRRQVAS